MSIKGIACTFMGTDKAYTYLTEREDLKEGDLCIVESNKPSERIITLEDGTTKNINILSIVQVVKINVELHTNIKYKHIIDKIENLSTYFANKGE